MAKVAAISGIIGQDDTYVAEIFRWGEFGRTTVGCAIDDGSLIGVE